MLRLDTERDTLICCECMPSRTPHCTREVRIYPVILEDARTEGYLVLNPGCEPPEGYEVFEISTTYKLAERPHRGPVERQAGRNVA